MVKHLGLRLGAKSGPWVTVNKGIVISVLELQRDELYQQPK